MSRQSVEVVRRMYEAFHGGDADRALRCFAPGVVVDASVRVDAGVGHGREELNRIVARWLAAWDEWSEEIEEVRDLDDRVLVISTQRGRGRGSGLEVETRYAMLYEVQSGSITRLTMYNSVGDALEAAGLPDSAD